jgi:hypothetical protein
LKNVKEEKETKIDELQIAVAGCIKIARYLDTRRNVGRRNKRKAFSDLDFSVLCKKWMKS